MQRDTQADRDDEADLPEDERRALVATAFHVFGEDAAFALALRLRVEFEDCAEDIERFRYRPH